MPFDQLNISKNASYGIVNITTQGCNMRQYKLRKDIIDLTDQNFFDFKVIKYNGRGKYRGATWLCKCICGNECIIPGGHLRAGMRKSCGCRSQARIDEVGVNRKFSEYKRKSSYRKKEFLLTREQFEKLIKSNCVYCGIEPNQILKRLKTKKLQLLYNGIDRKDPSVGYLIENCVSACRYCNQSKSDMTIEQWSNHLKRIIKHGRMTNGI